MNSSKDYTKAGAYKIGKNDIEIFEEKYSMYGISRFTKRDWILYYKIYHNTTPEQVKEDCKQYVTRKIIY
tara:strand:- start:387 stop:596 length:210 start_codon:yes stop_codon:yes gene_type:complete